ncbi:MAG: hypothetical protein RLZZ399_1069 [Verrucomicrobiota bacterium]|jgi:hypothetical protein
MGSALLIFFAFVFFSVGLLFFLVRANAALSLARGHWQGSFDELREGLQKFHESTRSLLDQARVLLRQEKSVCEEVTSGLADAVQSLERVSANPADSREMAALFGAQNRLLQKLESMRRISAPLAEWKGGRNFLGSMRQLAEAAKGLEETRRAYNEVARAFNRSRSRFPVVLVAGFLGFHRMALLEEREERPVSPIALRTEPKAAAPVPPVEQVPAQEAEQTGSGPRVFYG